MDWGPGTAGRYDGGAGSAGVRKLLVASGSLFVLGWGGLWGEALGVAEFLVGELDVGGGEVEEGPGAVVSLELGENDFQDGVRVGSGGLGFGDGFA